MNITITGGVSTVVCQVTSPKSADFFAYEYVWRKDGIVLRTRECIASEDMLEPTESGSYTCTAREMDTRRRFSASVVSPAVDMHVLASVSGESSRY